MDRNTLYDESPRPRKGSRALDRYLEGWIVRETLDANGKTCREYVYVGDYYLSGEKRGQRILRKLGYTALFAAAMALLLLGATRYTGANSAGYVAISQGLVLLCAVWVVSSLFTYVTAPHKLVVSDYKSGVKTLLKSSRTLALAFACPALATLVHQFADPAQRGTELLCVLGYLAGGALMLLLHLLEKRVVYTAVPSSERIGKAAMGTTEE